MTNVRPIHEGVDRREAWATASGDDSVIIKNEALHLLTKIAAWQITLFVITALSVAGFFFIAIAGNDDEIRENAAAIKANTVEINYVRSEFDVQHSFILGQYKHIEEQLKRIEDKLDAHLVSGLIGNTPKEKSK